MKESLPVIFWHRGNHDYLELAVKQCKKYNERVILMGNSENRFLSDVVEWHDMDDYVPLQEWEDFEKIYKPMSTNNNKFEINCFKRFYAIREFILRNGIDKFVYLDSDILCYCNYSDLEAVWNYDVGMCIPKNQPAFRWVANCGISFWTLDALKEYLIFCESTYQNNLHLLEKKWQHHIVNSIPGGVCDMTLQYLWNKQNHKFKTTNLAAMDTSSNGIMDFNFNSSENYEKKEYIRDEVLGIKKVTFEGEFPYFVRQDGKRVRALSIHFLGGAKPYLEIYALRKPITFKIRLNAILRRTRRKIGGKRNALRYHWNVKTK